MLSSVVIMQPIALLTANQKWEISFKIIDSRKFGVRGAPNKNDYRFT